MGLTPPPQIDPLGGTEPTIPGIPGLEIMQQTKQKSPDFFENPVIDRVSPREKQT